MPGTTPQEGLWTFYQTLTATHLQAALETLHDARERLASDSDHVRHIKARHSAISAIIHCYCALESALNLLGHEMFDDPESRRYICPQHRDVPLELLVKAWSRKLPIVEKLRFVVSRAGLTCSASLAAQLAELTTLRNWLVHGFIYKTTLLLSRTGDTSFNVLGREDSVEWQKRFPNSKFQPFDLLSYEDGVTALRIVFEALKQLSAATEESFTATPCYGEGLHIFVISKSTDVSAAIEEQVGKKKQANGG
jgi:hypothetical protein